MNGDSALDVVGPFDRAVGIGTQAPGLAIPRDPAALQLYEAEREGST